jgi:Tyrosine phosphatase family
VRPLKILALLLTCFANLATLAAASESLPPNFHEVEPGIYRGGSLTRASAAWLRASGIRTIIKLDGKNPDEFDYGIPVHAHYINGLGLNLNRELIREILLDLDASRRLGPIYIHCEKGADRTGLVVALYRVTQGWIPEEAYAEMYEPQFGHSPLQVWMDYKFKLYSSSIDEIMRGGQAVRGRGLQATRGSYDQSLGGAQALAALVFQP